MTLSVNHRKNVQPISKKVFIAPVISHSTYCSHKSSLTGAAPHLKGKKSQGTKERGKKRKKKIKRLLSKPNEVHLVAASAQPDAVSCTSNRNRAHLLRRKGFGQAKNQGFGQATTDICKRTPVVHT